VLPKSRRIEGGERVGAFVARGDAEIGFQQISELLPVDGIDSNARSLTMSPRAESTSQTANWSAYTARHKANCGAQRSCRTAMGNTGRLVQPA
jgi:hypothetical protein